MARIFSISFTHMGTAHNAIISVKENPFFTEYQVNMLDDGLNDSLPSSKIVSSAPGQFTFYNISKEDYTPLMHELLNAISSHIYAVRLSDSAC